MKKTLTKKEIVNMLLNQNLEVEDEEELLDLLVDQPIAIDVDKTDKETSTFGTKISDKTMEEVIIELKEAMKKYLRIGE